LPTLRGILQLARRLASLNPLAAAVVLGTGVYLGSLGWWKAPWFHVGLVVFLVSSTVAATVIKPFAMKLGAAMNGSAGAMTPDLDSLRWSLRWDLAADALLANDLALLFLMLAKPPLAESIGAVSLLNVVLLAHRLIRRRIALLPPTTLRP